MTAHNRRPLIRPAFTLIELVVVIVIMAILSTLATMSLRGTMDRYQLSRAAETIEMFDARARRDARRARTPVGATIQRDRNRLVIDNIAQFQLPDSVKIKQIRVLRRVTAGSRFELRYNREGWSPTYAVELERGNMNRWLVILGVSGQVIPLADEGEVDEILSL